MSLCCSSKRREYTSLNKEINVVVCLVCPVAVVFRKIVVGERLSSSESSGESSLDDSDDFNHQQTF